MRNSVIQSRGPSRSFCRESYIVSVSYAGSPFDKERGRSPREVIPIMVASRLGMALLRPCDCHLDYEEHCSESAENRIWKASSEICDLGYDESKTAWCSYPSAVFPIHIDDGESSNRSPRTILCGSLANRANYASFSLGTHSRHHLCNSTLSQAPILSHCLVK